MKDKSYREDSLFVVLEGIDGSGTTTQGDKLKNKLRNQGHRVNFTHEPTDGPAGMLVRLGLSGRLLGSNFEYFDDGLEEIESSTSLDPGVLALLYAADRLDHIKTQIEPCLRNGRIVICDRYVMSTLAYQGLLVSEKWIKEINKRAIKPDITIYLDVPVEYAQHRMKQTRWTKDVYEDEKNMRMVRKRYKKIIEEEEHDQGEVVTIDSTLPKKEVASYIYKLVSEKTPNQSRPKELTLFS
jgi:dTMP kinase